MANASFNITRYRGDTPSLVYTVYDEDGVVADITSATVRWTVRSTPASTTVITLKIVGDGITLTTPTLGVLTVAFTTADACVLTAGTFAYDLEVTTTNGIVRTLISGDWIIREDVSRT